jgi:hypothetical protein
MLYSESVTSFHGKSTQIIDELPFVGEIMDPIFMGRTTLNNFTKPWGPFIRGIVSGRICLLGRDFGMISFRRIRDSPQSPHNNSGLPKVMRTLLCGLRERRRAP